MGVNGLWKLLNPVARPVALETLEKRRLAIDASIWLYQFQMAMRDRKTGETLQGAHVLGTFRRIAKLVYHGIQPVFVFDGDAPMLKKRTIEQRRRRKEGAGQSLARTAKALLSAQLRAHVADRELRKQEARKKKDKGKGKTLAPADTGDIIDDNAVYLEDLESGNAPRPRRISTPPPTGRITNTTSPAKKHVPRDQYALPDIHGPLETRAKATDARIATEQEERDFFEEMRPDFFDSEEFASLSTQMKYEIIGEQRLKSRQVNHQRVQQMKLLPTPLDFSQSQIQNLMERNQYTQKLLEVTDELGKAAIKIPTRVAGSRGKVYELIKQDPSKGTGYVLGVRNPELKNTAPITIDTTTDESAGETDSDDFEEVGVTPKKHEAPTIDPEVRRMAALEAIRARLGPIAPEPEFDPYLDLPTASGGPSLFRADAHAPIVVDDSADADLQAALEESALLARISEAVQEQEARNRSLREGNAVAGGSGLSAAEKQATPSGGVDPGQETDDSLEYVDISTGPTSPKIPPPPPIAATAAVINLADSDDDSDDFEEVAVSASVPPPSLPAVEHRPAPNPPPPPPTTDAPPTRRTLMESILQSDDESDDDMEIVESAPIPSPAVNGNAASSSYAASRRQAQERPVPAPSPQPPPVEHIPPPAERIPPPAPPPAAAEPPPIIARDFATSTAHTTQQKSKSGPEVKISALPQPEPKIGEALVEEPEEMREEEKEEKPIRPTAVLVDDDDEDADSEDNMEEVHVTTSVGGPPARRSPSPAQLVHRPTPSPPPIAPQPHTNTNTPLDQAAALAPPSHVPPTLSSSILQQIEDFLPPADLPPLPPLPDLPKASSNEAQQELGAPFEVEQPPPANDDEDEEEEEFFDWERSPTPPPRNRDGPALFRSPDPDDFIGEEEEPDYEEEEEQEMIRNLTREQDQYADMLSQLKNRKIEDMRTEARGDVARLLAQKNADQRNADGVTRTMAADIQELLVLFGIPFVTAPQEAEAECAELLSRSLVDGIVTDDSDVFLFGGSRIYRHMFEDKQIVECYLMSDLDRELGLDRDKLIQLAYLLGGDYADGLHGVGPVQGRELLADFDGKDGLQKFKAWWKKVQEGRDDQDEDTNTPFRRRFKRSHKKLVIDDNWPNPEIAKAYYKPVVNESDEKLEWGSIDLDGLRLFLQKTLSWSQDKTNETMLPLIQRQQLRAQGKLKQQGFISDYFDVTAGNGPLQKRGKGRAGYENKRLQNVLKAHRRQHGEAVESTAEEDAAEPSTEEEELPPPPKRAAPASRKMSKTGSTSSSSKAKKSKKKKSTSPDDDDDDDAPAPAPRKRAPPMPKTKAERRKLDKARKDARAAARGGLYSSSEDLDAPPAREAAPRPKRKATKRPAREVFSTSESEGSAQKRRKEAEE